MLIRYSRVLSSPLLVIIGMILFLGLLSCGSDTRPRDTAGIAFKLQWPDEGTPARSPGAAKRVPLMVQTVRISISAPDMTAMSRNFAADAGTGSISNVPVGSNRTITFEGLDAGNTALYSGSVTGVTLASGVTFNCGTVPMTVVSGIPILVGGTMQGKALNLTGVVTTIAGIPGHTGSNDKIGQTALFQGPKGITSDGTNLYVTDSFNNTIRKIVIATGDVTTFAGTVGVSGSTDGTGAAALFNNPCGIASDGTNLYVAEQSNHTIRKIVIATAAVTTLAGTAGLTGSTNGTGAAARFNVPKGITTDGTNLYVADTSNNTIRQIVISTGVVTTLAGAAGVKGSTDGIGTAALFSFNTGTVPAPGITTDNTNLYVSDCGNNTIRIIVIASGTVTTLAGSAGIVGSTDGNGTAALFNGPKGISTDGTNLYVTDSYNFTIRKINISSGAVTTFAGTSGLAGTTDKTGTAGLFTFGKGPSFNTIVGTNLYQVESNSYTIRKIVLSSGAVTTIAGTPNAPGYSDGPGLGALFNQPRGIATDGTNLYISDAVNRIIRKMNIATGEVITLAGTAGSSGFADGTGTAARFNAPYRITTDGTNLFVTDNSNHNIRKIVIATGEVSTLAGSAGLSGFVDGTGAAAKFSGPRGITTDGTNLYVADFGNHAIRKIVIATGAVTTLAGDANTTGWADGTGTAAVFAGPSSIMTDGTNLTVADETNCTIRKIVISTEVVTTVAGTAGICGSTAGGIDIPKGMTTDGINRYIVDSATDVIGKVVIATGEYSILAGTSGANGSTDETGAAALFYQPFDITSDGTSLYVVEQGNHTIRKIQ